ncbi:AAA family ATPase [Neobacillus niacini]|uniref:AAA family ATPase n=1 Tax=Neobacillus niacini TaxID=86668 RepID=UPI002FFDCC39
MQISIENLEMQNFKGHRELKLELSELVKISGKNGEGKSSIGEAVTWNLYGADILGNTLDPTPLYEHEGEISTTVFLKVDDKLLKLKRAIEGGKNTFYINDIPKKATEYKELIESLFEKELFLSIFNPSYFSSQHWKEQRAQLLKYIDEPLNKEVLANMTNVTRVSLEEPLKKHSLNELDKLHKDRFRKRDKEIERAGARVATLREQYEKSLGSDGVDLKEVQEKMLACEIELEKAQKINEGIAHQEKKLLELNAQEKMVREQILKKKKQIDSMNEQPIQEHCESCGQALDYNARETLTQTHLKKVEKAKHEGKELVTTLQQILEGKKQLGELEQRVDVSELMNEIAKYRHILMDSQRINGLADEVKKAEEDYEVIRGERGESQSICDAIKEFVDVKASLMVNKVNELFDTLTVKLFDKQKNDSVKQTFEIELDGKPYQKLSTAEKIRAGIEVIHVLQQQSGVEGPTFIDNAESIIDLKVAPGQAIISTVKNNKLKIEGGKLA